MKLDNIFKQIAMIALAAVVAVPATFGMKEQDGGRNNQPSDGFSNQSLKIEAGEQDENKGKDENNENLKINFSLNSEEKEESIGGDSKPLKLTLCVLPQDQLANKNNDFWKSCRQLCHLKLNGGKSDDIDLLLKAMQKSGHSLQEIQEGIKLVSKEIDPTPKKDFRTYCKMGFCSDLKIFFAGIYYNTKNELVIRGIHVDLEKFNAKQMRESNLVCLEGAPQESVNIPQWLVEGNLRSKLDMQTTKNLPVGRKNKQFFIGLAAGSSFIESCKFQHNTSSDISKEEQVKQYDKYVTQNGPFVFVTPQDFIKDSVSMFCKKNEKKMNDEEKNEMTKKITSKVKPFRGKLNFCFPEHGFFDVLDLSLMQDDKHLPDGSNFRVKFDQKQQQLRIEDCNGNLVSVCMPADEFIKGFMKRAKKICFFPNGPWTTRIGLESRKIVMKNLNECKEVNHFEIPERGDLKWLLQEMIELKKKNDGKKINLTRDFCKLKSISFDDWRSHFGLSDCEWPISERLKEFCEQYPEITDLNLAGWWISAKDVIEIVEPLKQLKFLVIGIRGYSKEGDSGNELIVSQYSEKDIGDIQNALPLGCKLIVVSWYDENPKQGTFFSSLLGKQNKELNAEFFDMKQMKIDEVKTSIMKKILGDEFRTTKDLGKVLKELTEMLLKKKN